MHLHTVPLVIDALSLATVAGWWVGVVPGLATTASLLWVIYCFAKEFYIWNKNRKNK